MFYYRDQNTLLVLKLLRCSGSSHTEVNYLYYTVVEGKMCHVIALIQIGLHSFTSKLYTYYHVKRNWNSLLEILEHVFLMYGWMDGWIGHDWCQSPNKSMEFEESSVDLWVRMVSRGTDLRKCAEKYLQHWTSQWAKWPLSLTKRKHLEPPELFLIVASWHSG